MLALLIAGASAQFILGPSFQMNKTVVVVQEGVSFDMQTYQDSEKGVAVAVTLTANGYNAQYTTVNTVTKAGTLYYAYESNGAMVCYAYAAGQVPWPFPSTQPVHMSYLKQGRYQETPVDVYEQSVGRYTRRLFTNVAHVASGAPFRAVLPNMEAMSLLIDATILNSTNGIPAAYQLPPACSSGRTMRPPVVRSATNVAASSVLGSRMTVPPQVKFDVRDPSNPREEFELMIREVAEGMRRHGRTLTPYVASTGLVSPQAEWTGPTTVDNSAYATAVRDQGMCGACWAFSSAATTEVVYNKLHNVTYTVGSSANWLSPQNLIDCASGDLNGTALFPSKGCFGGWPLVGMSHIVLSGINTEEAYPYDSANGRTCLQSTTGASLFPLASAHYIPYANGPSSNILLLMAAVVREGAVTAILNADPTLFYPGGIFNDPGCAPSMGHAVTLLGFGTDEASGLDYWLVKNSFGAAWGEAGFFRIARGVNMCGIEQMGFVAVAAA